MVTLVVTSTFRQEIRPTEEIPKPIVVFFMLMQVLFGYKHGFEATVNRYLKAAVHFISLLLFTWIVFATCAFILFFKDYFAWHMFPVFTYYISMFIILRLPKYTMFNFYKDLSEIDKEWNLVAKNFRIGVLTLVYALSLLFLRTTVVLYICFYYYSDSVWGFWITRLTLGLMCYIFHVPPLVNALMFYEVYVRIKLLRSEITNARIHTRHLKIIFKSIADCLNKIRISMDNVIAVGFIADCAYGIFSMYGRICYVKQYQHIILKIGFIVDTLLFVIGVWLPAGCAEMVAHEIDKMKIVICERLICETDVDISEELMRLLRYVEGRPLLRPAWRLVPVDFQRPLTLLSICVTYLIVLLQFTHTY